MIRAMSPARLTAHFIRILAALVLLAHLLAGIALVAFGWRAGGYALNGPAIHVYFALTFIALCACLVGWRRTDDWAQAARVVLPMGLALAAAGVWLATSMFGAKYATWGAITGDEGRFVLINLAYALLGCGLALGLRWPRLLLAWATAHGLVLLLCPFAAFAPPNLYEILPWLFVTPAYGLSAWALGWKPNRRVVGMVVGTGALAVIAPLLTSLVFSSYSLLVAEVAWFAIALLPLGFYGWRARREWEADALEQPPAAPSWIAASLGLVCGALLAGYLLDPNMLPRAGETQLWISSTHVVPVHAWLPTLAWSAQLFDSLPWLAGLFAVVGVVSGWRTRPALSFSPVSGLLWTAIALLLTLILGWVSPLRFVLNVVRAGASPVLYPIHLLLVAFGLLFVARKWERPGSVSGRAAWLLLAFSLLGLFLWREADQAWHFARFLFFPQPDWARVREYAPLSPTLIAGVGLALHVALGGFGLCVLWQWIGIARGEATLLLTLWRAALIGGGALLAVFAVWHIVTTPHVVRAVPAPGAVNVPRDTQIVVELAPLTPQDELLAGGLYGGASAHYADTGEYIPATSGSPASGVFVIDPELPLRENAVVEVKVRYGNKRAYLMHFTTGEAAAPTSP